MTLWQLRRWSRVVALVLLAATVRLPHAAADDRGLRALAGHSARRWRDGGRAGRRRLTGARTTAPSATGRACSARRSRPLGVAGRGRRGGHDPGARSAALVRRPRPRPSPRARSSRRTAVAPVRSSRFSGNSGGRMFPISLARGVSSVAACFLFSAGLAFAQQPVAPVPPPPQPRTGATARRAIHDHAARCVAPEPSSPSPRRR